MKMPKCVICEKDIDLSACNQEYAYITFVTDDDINGTRKTQMYLCAEHAGSLHTRVLSENLLEKERKECEERHIKNIRTR